MGDASQVFLVFVGGLVTRGYLLLYRKMVAPGAPLWDDAVWRNAGETLHCLTGQAGDWAKSHPVIGYF